MSHPDSSPFHSIRWDACEMFRVFADPDGNAYFPKGREFYYTYYLSAMAEPSLLIKPEDGSEVVFRFTFLRSFDDPIVVRFNKNGGELKGRAVRIKMEKDYSLGPVVFDKELTVSEEILKEIQSILTTREFWTPLSNAEEEIMASGKDGSQWIFEKHDAAGYRLIDIWSPEALPKIVDSIGGRRKKSPEVRDFLPYATFGKKLLDAAKAIGNEDTVPMNGIR